MPKRLEVVDTDFDYAPGQVYRHKDNSATGPQLVIVGIDYEEDYWVLRRLGDPVPAMRFERLTTKDLDKFYYLVRVF